MAKFNKKKTPVVPTEVNKMGERAYKMEAREELVATVLTTFLSDSYYEKESTTVDRIRRAAEQVDPLFVAKLAIYARTQANMRSVSHLLAAELARRASGTKWASNFYKKVAVRPDDLSEILSAYQNVNGKDAPIAASMKRGFRSFLEGMDAYRIDKYKMKGRDISLVDLVNLFHPTPRQINSEAYRRLMKGESLDGLYESKILEKEMSKAGKSQQTSTDDAKQEAIELVLSNLKGMPIFNLLRNLRNILRYAPASVDEACRQLTIKDKVLKSRLLPFRFATAYAEIEKLTYSDLYDIKILGRKISFEDEVKTAPVSETEFDLLKQTVLQSIEIALEYSVANIPKLEGRTAILIDHSGSMRGDGGGHSRVSAFSKTTTAMIGNLFGSMLGFAQDNVYIGLFGDRLLHVPIDRKRSLLDFNSVSFKTGDSCGGGTEDGLYQFLDECIRNNTKVDNLIIFSDMVIGSDGRGGWDGSSRAPMKLGRFQDLFKKFKSINPTCRTIVVDLRQTGGKSVFHQNLGVTNVAGWSEKIFDVLGSTCKGWTEVIETIERIEI